LLENHYSFNSDNIKELVKGYLHNKKVKNANNSVLNYRIKLDFNFIDNEELVHNSDYFIQLDSKTENKKGKLFYEKHLKLKDCETYNTSVDNYLKNNNFDNDDNISKFDIKN